MTDATQAGLQGSRLRDANLSSVVSALLETADAALFQGDDRTAANKSARLVLQALYDRAVGTCIQVSGTLLESSSLLKQLSVDGFSTEQIWSQMEKLFVIVDRLWRRSRENLENGFQLMQKEAEMQIDALFHSEGGTEERPVRDPSDARRQEQTEREVEVTEKQNKEYDNSVEDTFLDLGEMKSFLEEIEDEQENGNLDDADLLGMRDNDADTDDDQASMDYGNIDEEHDLSGDDDKTGQEAMYEDMYGPRNEQRQSPNATNETEPPDMLLDKNPYSRDERPPKQEQSVSRLMQERAAIDQTIQALEEEAVGDKEWPFRGEVLAGDRPLNSALEIDLDYDTTVKPPPKPTQEDMDAIEDLIKRRIADRSFDDVERVVPPPIEETRKVLELDDTKAKKGLGDIYAEEYAKGVHGFGTLEEKQEKLRVQARRLFKEACSRLDALTHYHFAPRPVIEDAVIKVTMPTVRMENGDLDVPKAPEEVYKPVSRTGEVTADQELSKQERKQKRAKRKRSGKASAKTEARSIETTRIKGRKSLVQQQDEEGKKRRKLLEKSKPVKKSKSSSNVFEQIQSLQSNPKERKSRKSTETAHRSSAEVKL